MTLEKTRNEEFDEDSLNENINRLKSIRVYVTKEDKKIIHEKAKESGMSYSAYLRWCGLNVPAIQLVSRSKKLGGD